MRVIIISTFVPTDFSYTDKFGQDHTLVGAKGLIGDESGFMTACFVECDTKEEQEHEEFEEKKEALLWYAKANVKGSFL